MSLSIYQLKKTFFSGDFNAWRLSRELFNNSIFPGENVLDAGCANGALLWSLLHWRSDLFIPWGFDIAPHLITDARQLFPDFKDHFWVQDFFASWPPLLFDIIIAPWAGVDVPQRARFELISNVVGHAKRLALFYLYDDDLDCLDILLKELQAAGQHIIRVRSSEGRAIVVEVLGEGLKL